MLDGLGETLLIFEGAGLILKTAVEDAVDDARGLDLYGPFVALGAVI